MTTSWTEIRVDVPLGWQELVGEALTFGPCSTVVFGTTSVAAEPAPEGRIAVRGFVMTGDDTPALRDELTARLGALVAAVEDPELAGLAPRYKALPPEDYGTSWRKDWKPFRVGRLVLLPPWCEEAPPRPGDLRLTIQPGGSFGSGRHATTRTCLRILDRRIRGGARPRRRRGQRSPLGGRRAARRGVDARLRHRSRFPRERRGAGRGQRSGAALLVPAGRLRGPRGRRDRLRRGPRQHLRRRPAGSRRGAPRALSPDGWFCFSGCRIDHRDATVAKLAEIGLEIDEEHVCGRWVTMTGRRA